MDFLEELRWRGMLHDTTPGIEEVLKSRKITGYIGFDPTASSITIGNYVQIMLLTLFQRAGHSPIILMGGATGRIGDPSGKDKERELKSFDVLDTNLEFQKQQMMKFLDFEGSNAAKIVNNYDFYANMNILDFLRDVGKTLTVSYMLSKDSVKNRLETGLSFTEFSYQLLQSYDFQLLYQNHDCILQMGGSDQWGNITSGTEFIRRNTEGKAYAITSPLLTKADGTKFGKSEQGNIWLDARLTSPYKFYQFWLNAADADLPKFLRFFSLKSREEIENLEATHATDPRIIKEILAEEITRRVHSDEDYEAVMTVSKILFSKDADGQYLRNLNDKAWKAIVQEIPVFEIDEHRLDEGVNICDLLVEAEILSSKSEARKAIQNNAINVNKVKITSHETIINLDLVIMGRYIMLENGKKNKHIVQINA